MKNIFFSIVLTSYNSEKYIKKTIENLIYQNYQKFEIILVDDGSNDKTIKIAKSFEYQKNIKLKIIQLKHTGLPARSRNVGIKNTKGEYICFLDADDLFYKNKLFNLNKIIQKKQNTVFYHNVFLTNKKKNLLCKKINSTNPLLDLLFNGNKIVLSSSCVKRSFIKKNKIKFAEKRKLISVEDYDFWLKIAKFKGSFMLIEKILGVYNLNNSSISKKRFIHFLNTFFLLNLYKNNFYKKNLIFFFRKLKILFSFIKISLIEKNFKFFFSLLKYYIFNISK